MAAWDAAASQASAAGLWSRSTSRHHRRRPRACAAVVRAAPPLLLSLRRRGQQDRHALASAQHADADCGRLRRGRLLLLLLLSAFTLAAQWSLGESLSLRGLYWLDADGDGCLDLLIDSAAADSQLLLNRPRCWDSAATEAPQFRLVSEPALGLQWQRSDSSGSTSTLITDVDGDEAVDVCQFRCGCADSNDDEEEEGGTGGGKSGQRAEPASACDFQCSLQCAVNTAARSDSPSTRFTVLTPIAVSTPSSYPSSSSSPVITSLLATDWNDDGVVELLLHSSSSPRNFSSFSLHAMSLRRRCPTRPLQPHSPASSSAMNGRHPCRAYPSSVCELRSPATTLRQQQPRLLLSVSLLQWSGAS